MTLLTNAGDIWVSLASSLIVVFGFWQITSFMVLLASCTLGAGVFFLRGLGSNEHVYSNLLTCPWCCLSIVPRLFKSPDVSLMLFVDCAGWFMKWVLHERWTRTFFCFFSWNFFNIKLFFSMSYFIIFFFLIFFSNKNKFLTRFPKPKLKSIQNLI